MSTRPAHVIADIDYRTPVPRDQAPTTCACGWEGTAAAFDEHRRTAPKEGQDMGRTGPTAKQQEAWDLVSRDGLSQVDAADRLSITQAGVQSRLRGYMEAVGLPGPIPGYGGGNGPITFRRVPPEALDAPATTSAPWTGTALALLPGGTTTPAAPVVAVRRAA